MTLSAYDLRELSSRITEPDAWSLTIAHVQQALDNGLACAHRAIASDGGTGLAARILRGDADAAHEFGADGADTLAAFLRHQRARAPAPSIDNVVPLTLEDVLAENDRTKAALGLPPTTYPTPTTGAAKAIAAPAEAATPVAPPVPSVPDLAWRLGMRGTYTSAARLAWDAKVRPLIVDGVRTCPMHRLRQLTGSDAEAAQVNVDMLAALDAEDAQVAEQQQRARELDERRRELRDAVRDAVPELSMRGRTQ